MKKPEITHEYKYPPINLTVGMRKGSGTFPLPQDIISMFENAGYYVEHLPSDGKSLDLFVSPPRHIFTGEDIRLTEEENE